MRVKKLHSRSSSPRACRAVARRTSLFTFQARAPVGGALWAHNVRDEKRRRTLSLVSLERHYLLVCAGGVSAFPAHHPPSYSELSTEHWDRVDSAWYGTPLDRLTLPHCLCGHWGELVNKHPRHTLRQIHAVTPLPRGPTLRPSGKSPAHPGWLSCSPFGRYTTASSLAGQRRRGPRSFPRIAATLRIAARATRPARLTEARETNLRGAAALCGPMGRSVGRTTGIGFLHSPCLR